MTELEDTILSLPVPIIADHQGGMKGSSALPKGINPTDQPGLATLLNLARLNKVFVKISGLYRSSQFSNSERLLKTDVSTGYEDLEPLIQALAREIPDRLIWGSDWPHTGSGKDRVSRSFTDMEPFRSVDNDKVMKNIREWVGSEVWAKMMTVNPSHIYM
jgi:predicted TIM-barrel fold metal-dependent hydrolase